VQSVKNEDVTPNFFMGKVKRHWQDFEWVLGLFDDRLGVARRRYKAFVAKGISEGRRDDLKGGGLIRSHGWLGSCQTDVQGQDV